VLRTRLIALDTPDALRSRPVREAHLDHTRRPSRTIRSVVRSIGTNDVTIEDRTMSIAMEGDAIIAPGIVKALVDAGARIVSVIPEERSLEDVYLRLLKDVQQ
jgi:hypothetical protein